MKKIYLDEKPCRLPTDDECMDYDLHPGDTVDGERLVAEVSLMRIHVYYQDQMTVDGEWVACPVSGAYLSVENLAELLPHIQALVGVSKT